MTHYTSKQANVEIFGSPRFRFIFDVPYDVDTVDNYKANAPIEGFYRLHPTLISFCEAMTNHPIESTGNFYSQWRPSYIYNSNGKIYINPAHPHECRIGFVWRPYALMFSLRVPQAVRVPYA